MKKIFYLLLSVFSFLGIGAKFSYADIPQQARIDNISQSTPLYLEASSSMQQQGGQTLLADHESHYSHSSHESHSSHSSHSSGY